MKYLFIYNRLTSLSRRKWYPFRKIFLSLDIDLIQDTTSMMAEAIKEENMATENQESGNTDTEKPLISEISTKIQSEIASDEPPKTEDTVADMTREELIDLHRSSSIYISNLESKLSAYEGNFIILQLLFLIFQTLFSNLQLLFPILRLVSPSYF